MIRYRAIARILSQFLLALAAVMLIPFGYGYFISADGVWEIGITALITTTSGIILWLVSSPIQRDFTQREGLFLVVLIWVFIPLFGCLPLYFSPQFPSFTDSFFESVSGFTTTGATVLTDIESLPEPLQLWRCFSHWLGGMGIVLLGIAILPLVGHGGMHLYRAEFSGAKSEKLKPRFLETVVSLGKIYLGLSLSAFLLLRVLGMSYFDAICHTFSVVATGGFSSRNTSIASFSNPAIEYTIIFLMMLSAISFVQHYRFWVERRLRSFFVDIETRFFLCIIACASLVLTVLFVFYDGTVLEAAFRSALFQITSITTGTGFATENFALWHPFAQLVLLVLMFAGGCTGSTAGGMKISRVLLLTRVVSREFKRMVERRGIFTVRFGNTVIPETTIQSLLNLVYIALFINLTSCMLLTAMGVDVLTSIAAVVASMFNVGPGLGSVGPTQNYGHLPTLAKWVLSFCMIAGRLEFYTVLVIFTPSFWRK